MREIGQRKKSHHIVKILILSAIFAAVIFGFLKVFNLEKIALKGPKTVVQLITDSGLKSDKGRINILLLGIGGDGHDGPDLTDTMILASVDKKNGDVVLISIPRDLWVPATKSKINAIYAFSQEKDGKGLQDAKSTVSELFGVPLHYAARVDFKGFVKAVDLIQGLDLTVDNSFSDPKYPIDGKEDDLCGLKIETQEKDGTKIQVVKDATGSAIPLDPLNDSNDPFTCRYETLTFKAGSQHMDGATALKYVRSRHGNNGEGSDFARSARQEKIIVAFREKVLSTKTFLDSKTIISLASTFGNSIDTDISNDDIPLFSKLALKVDKTNLRRVVLNADNKDSPLEIPDSANFDGQFVLTPKNNNWTDLAEYVQGEIYKTDNTTQTPKVQP